MFQNSIMQHAIDIARNCKDEVPIAAIITDSNYNIIASGINQVETANDPTAHAEMLAIREATKLVSNKFLSGYYIFTTLEPCPMCATAIAFARFSRLYFGALDIKSGGVFSGPQIFNSTSCHHKDIEIYGGIMESECKEMLQDFFAAKRKG